MSKELFLSSVWRVGSKIPMKMLTEKFREKKRVIYDLKKKRSIKYPGVEHGFPSEPIILLLKNQSRETARRQADMLPNLTCLSEAA